MSQDYGNLQKHLNPNPVQRYLLQRFHRQIASLLKATGAERVLDAGCGEGFVVSYLLQGNDRLTITGIDCSLEAIEMARQMMPPVLSEAEGPVLSKACPEPRRRVEGQSRRAVAARCDLLIVDEIGPLELEQGEGFAPILELLPVEGPTHTLIVVRPALLDQLLLRMRDAECTVFSVTEENRNKLPLRIVEELWGDGCLS